MLLVSSDAHFISVVFYFDQISLILVETVQRLPPVLVLEMSIHQ